MKKTDLTKGNVMNVLLALALPIMGSSLLQFTYNLVDMLWIGRLGSGAVASIGFLKLFYCARLCNECFNHDRDWD